MRSAGVCTSSLLPAACMRSTRDPPVFTPPAFWKDSAGELLMESMRSGIDREEEEEEEELQV